MPQNIPTTRASSALELIYKNADGNTDTVAVWLNELPSPTAANTIAGQLATALAHGCHENVSFYAWVVKNIKKIELFSGAISPAIPGVVVPSSSALLVGAASGLDTVTATGTPATSGDREGKLVVRFPTGILFADAGRKRLSGTTPIDANAVITGLSAITALTNVYNQVLTWPSYVSQTSDKKLFRKRGF